MATRPAADRPMASHGRLRTPRAASSIARSVAIGLCVVLVAAVSIGAIAFDRFASGLRQHVVALPGEDEPEAIPQIGPYSGAVNMLLVGSDTRTGQQGQYGENPGTTLNDVNILVRISEDHSKATVISFPRDLYVDRPGCTNPAKPTDRLAGAQGVKINSVLEYGGLACVRDTVAGLTGMRIPFVALITFDGVVEMSNAVGGVPVCVAKRIDDDYTGLHLSKGEHTLRGTAALKYLRTRHGVGDGSDLTRISSQQVFLSSLVRTMKSSATLTDVTKLYGLSVAASQSLTLSKSLGSVDTMVSIARAVAGIPLSRFVLAQYPTSLSGGGVVANTEAADVLISAVRADRTLRLSKQQVGATDGTGSVEEDGPTSSPSPSPSASPGPSESADSDYVVDLPAAVGGQTVEQRTCSVGNELGRR